MKFICANTLEHFIRGKTYKCTVVKQGIIFIPWIIREKIQTIEEKSFSSWNIPSGITSRYSKKIVNGEHYEEIKIVGEENTESKLTIVGYNISNEKNEVIYFTLERFNKCFKSLKQLRQEKLDNITNE